MTDAANHDPNLLFFNGIDATSGDYALPPMTADQLKEGILGTPEPEAQAMSNWLKLRNAPDFSLKAELDPNKLEEAGWGVVFPVNTDPAIVDALRPLLDWRKQQAGDLYREFMDNKVAVRPKESSGAWLGRNGAENYGPADPEKMPYYLLLVGSPDQIDYRFQYLLDVQYAVGRIYFETPDEYAYYAQSVVAAEKQQIQRKRLMAFFGVANEGDDATNQSSRNLIAPIADYVTNLKLKTASPWAVQTVLGEEATKERLGAFLGGADTPALLFTASHGMKFPLDDPRQAHGQGALLCQDWPGPYRWRKPIPEIVLLLGGRHFRGCQPVWQYRLPLRLLWRGHAPVRRFL